VLLAVAPHKGGQHLVLSPGEFSGGPRAWEVVGKRCDPRWPPSFRVAHSQSQLRRATKAWGLGHLVDQVQTD